RIGGSSGAVGISYATTDGTAGAGTDFTATTGTLTWADAETNSKTITVTIRNDSVHEADESMTVSLLNPTGGAVRGAVFATTLTITDDDVLDVTPPTQPSAPSVTGDGTPAPVLSGTTEANATVTIYDSGVPVGTAIADGAGAWSYTVTLASGSHLITVTATDAANNSSVISSPITVVISSASPPSPGPTASSSGGGGGGGGGCGMGSTLALLAMVVGLRTPRSRRGRLPAADK
ncbi:MAG: Calx-beta domain-containing protein, partial [Planctomycetota bacterium]